MKRLQACVGLAHGWETATEGSAVEDRAVWREGGLLPSPASASLSWKFFFKIIYHEQQKASEGTQPPPCGQEQRYCWFCRGTEELAPRSMVVPGDGPHLSLHIASGTTQDTIGFQRKSQIRLSLGETQPVWSMMSCVRGAGVLP